MEEASTGQKTKNAPCVCEEERVDRFVSQWPGLRWAGRWSNHSAALFSPVPMHVQRSNGVMRHRLLPRRYRACGYLYYATRVLEITVAGRDLRCTSRLSLKTGPHSLSAADGCKRYRAIAAEYESHDSCRVICTGATIGHSRYELGRIRGCGRFRGVVAGIGLSSITGER